MVFPGPGIVKIKSIGNNPSPPPTTSTSVTAINQTGNSSFRFSMGQLSFRRAVARITIHRVARHQYRHRS